MGIDIFEYTDFRKYLRELYAHRKAASPSFSYRFIAQKAGISSPSFIGKIFSGDSNISHQTLLRLVEVFQLAGPEAEYFELMVNYDHARTESDKRHYFQRMNAIRARQGRPQDEAGMNLHSAWYVPPLLDLIELGLFRGNFADLGRMVTPPISAQETRLGLEILLMCGYVLKDGQGRYQVSPRSGGRGRERSAPPSSMPPPSSFPGEEPGETLDQLLQTIPPDTPGELLEEIRTLQGRLLQLVHRAHGR